MVDYIESFLERIVSISFPISGFTVMVFGTVGSGNPNLNVNSLHVKGGLGVYSGTITLSPPLPTPPSQNGYFTDPIPGKMRSKTDLFGAKFTPVQGVKDTLTLAFDFKGGFSGGQPVGYSGFCGIAVYSKLNPNFNAPEGNDPNFIADLLSPTELVGFAFSPVVNQVFTIGQPHFGQIQELIAAITFPLPNAPANTSVPIVWSIGAYQ